MRRSNSPEGNGELDNMSLRALEPSLQAKANAGILEACERFAIDARGRADFLFDAAARYTGKKLAASTLEAYAGRYWAAWRFFAAAGYYESLLPLVRSPALPRPFPAMQVEALTALLRYKRRSSGADLLSPVDSEPLRHVVTGEAMKCTNEWTEKDVRSFTAAISRMHRAVGHRIDRSPSQTVCDACLAKYRGADGDRTRMEPCARHRLAGQTVNPPIIRWGDPTRTARYKKALRLWGGDAAQESSPGATMVQTVVCEEDDTGNNFKVDWMFEKLSKLPIASRYPDLLERCRPIVEAWHAEFSNSQPPVWWSRQRRNLPKELNESAFILDELVSIVDGYDGDRPMTIVDMCSGVGFLSMFLSHLLPPSKVSRIVAVDILFRSHNDTSTRGNGGKGQKPTGNPELKTRDHDGDDGDAMTPRSRHLQTDHLLSPIHPIPIRPRRANIKKGRELRQIAQHCVARAPGPVVILGIHLCKSLSVHTVRLFHATAASRLYLKPCCLPGRRDLSKRHPPFWKFELMEGGGFGVETLYCTEIKKEEREDRMTPPFAGIGPSDAGAAAAIQKREARRTDDGAEETGHAHSGVRLFSRWVELLCDAAGTAPGATAEILRLPVQVRGYQNQFIVATR